MAQRLRVHQAWRSCRSAHEIRDFGTLDESDSHREGYGTCDRLRRRLRLARRSQGTAIPDDTEPRRPTHTHADDATGRVSDDRAAHRSCRYRRKGRQSLASCDRTTTYLRNSGTLDKAAAMANHASTRTTQIYARGLEALSLDEVRC